MCQTFCHCLTHAVLPLSNFTHMVPDPLVTERLWERIATHFLETLSK